MNKAVGAENLSKSSVKGAAFLVARSHGFESWFGLEKQLGVNHVR
jgi:hypothetical protein